MPNALFICKIAVFDATHVSNKLLIVSAYQQLAGGHLQESFHAIWAAIIHLFLCLLFIDAHHVVCIATQYVQLTTISK